MSDSEDPFEISGLNEAEDPFDSPPPQQRASLAPVALRGTAVAESKLRTLEPGRTVDCLACGKANALGFRFCRGCGQEADEATTATVAKEEPPLVPAPNNAAKKTLVGRGRGAAPPPPASKSGAPHRATLARPPPKVPVGATQALPVIPDTSPEERSGRAGLVASAPVTPVKPVPPRPAGRGVVASVSQSVIEERSVPSPAGRGRGKGLATAQSVIEDNSSIIQQPQQESRRSQVLSAAPSDVLASRLADEETRRFLLEVVKSHEEGIRDLEAAEKKDKPKPATLSKATSKLPLKAVQSGVAMDLMTWSSLGLDGLAEQEGGQPQAVTQCVLYFNSRRAFNYPGICKTPPSIDAVNKIMDAFARSSFVSYDDFGATPLDVLASLRTFLLIVPESPVPPVLFHELLEACYEVANEKRVTEVRKLLMRVSFACRGVLRSVLELAKKIIVCQPSLQIQDMAGYLGAAIARPEGRPSPDVDSQSYAVALALLELGEAAFDAKVTPETAAKAVTMASVIEEGVAGGGDDRRVAALEEELKSANEKMASLTRQLEDSRKAENALKRKADALTKEVELLRRKNAEITKQMEQWKANAVIDNMF